jgi:hypothetical protein
MLPVGDTGDVGDAGVVGKLEMGENGPLMCGEAPRRPIIDGSR